MVSYFCSLYCIFFRFTIENKNNVKVQIINLGGIITNIYIPDKNGRVDDITLGYDTLAGTVYK